MRACPPADARVARDAQLDRSNSIGASNWNQRVIPWMRGVVNELDLSGGSRASVIAMPITAGSRNDYSGGARAIVDRTTSISSITTLLDDVPTNVSGTSDANAATGLWYPSTSWGHTPTWLAVKLAERLLYDGVNPDGRKLLIIITDGAPSATAGGSNRHKRAVYLTLEAGRQLKARGTTIYGVGLNSGNWVNMGSKCEPLCEQEGAGLFGGNPFLNGQVDFGFSVDSSDPGASQGCSWSSIVTGTTTNATCTSGSGSTASNFSMPSLAGTSNTSGDHRNPHRDVYGMSC